MPDDVRAPALIACLLLQVLLAFSSAARATEPAPAFSVALAARADTRQGAANIADCRAMLRHLASTDMQLRTGLSWRLAFSEHVAASPEETGRKARAALAAHPSLVLCADGLSLREVLLARTGSEPPVFMPEGVPMEETALDGIPPARLQGLYIHTSTPDANPKMASMVSALGAKRIGFLHVGSEDATDLLPARVAGTAAKLGCETVVIAIPSDSHDECLKGMRRLAALKPDVVYLGHLHCATSSDLGALLQPLFEADIPAIGTESLGEATAGALLAYYQRAGTMERRNAYRMLRILFAGRVELAPLATPSELAINMETASRLGIRLPLSLLAEAEYLVWKTQACPAP